MGLPPAWRLTRKLIRTYLIRKRPQFYDQKIQEAQNQLRKHSQDMTNQEKADKAYQKMLELQKEQAAFNKQIKQLELKKQIIGQLNMPPYKHKVKGKCRDLYTGYRPIVRSVYDGIRYKQIIIQNFHAINLQSSNYGNNQILLLLQLEVLFKFGNTYLKGEIYLKQWRTV